MTPRLTAEQVLTRLGLTRERLPAALIVAFVVGLVTGWWLLGWVLFPVEWTNAGPADLEPTDRRVQGVDRF